MSLANQIVRPGIYVDLDSLFDTRLATLHYIDPLLAAHALDNGYLDRLEDAFTYCNYDTFKKAYSKRDENTLADSIMTHVKDIVLEFVNDAINNFKSVKTKIFPTIYINVYPYKISSDSVGELLKPFYVAAKGNVNVHIINSPPEDLTPEVCKKEFSYMVMYDYMAWFLKQGELENLQKTSLSEITLIAPRIYPSGKPDEQELLEFSRNGAEPFQCTEMFFSPYIKLELYISRMFSAKIEDGFIEAYIKQIEKYQSENGGS